MPCLATIPITLSLTVPAMSVELFRLPRRGQGWGTLEYVFEAGAALYLNRDRQKPGGLLTAVATQCFGWRMEEEAKIEFTINNWLEKTAASRRRNWGLLDRGACRSAEDVGLQLADAKPILGRLQEIVVSEQLQRYCEAVRPCPRFHHRRHLKDYRQRRYDTVFGRLAVGAPRFDGR